MPPAAAPGTPSAPSSTADVGGAIIAQLTVAELRALCAWASPDEDRVMHHAVTFLFDGRACASNGHCAVIRGSTTTTVALTADMTAGSGVRLQLADVEAFLKDTKAKARVRVRRASDRPREVSHVMVNGPCLRLELIGPTGGIEREVVLEGSETFAPVAYVFHKGSRKKGNGEVGVNVRYLALLAKIEAALPKSANSPWMVQVGGYLDPILFTAQHSNREGGLDVVWTAAIMPVKL